MNQPIQVLQTVIAPDRQHLNDYLAECRIHKSPLSVDVYEWHLTKFFKYALGSDIKAYSRKLVRNFCMHQLAQGYTPKGVHNSEVVVKGFFSWLHENEIIEANPLMGLRPFVPVAKSQPKDPFTQEEYEKIKEAAKEAKPDWFGACVIAWNTGLRLGDVSILQWDYVDLLAQTITLVPNKIRKIGRLIQIPIPPELSDFLVQRKAESPPVLSPYVLPEMSMDYRHWANSRLTGQFAIILKKAGIKGKSFHSFRRTFNTRAIASGVSPAIVSQLTGQNINTVMQYVRIDLDTKRKAVEQMNQARKEQK